MLSSAVASAQVASGVTDPGPQAEPTPTPAPITNGPIVQTVGGGTKPSAAAAVSCAASALKGYPLPNTGEFSNGATTLFPNGAVRAAVPSQGGNVLPTGLSGMPEDEAEFFCAALYRFQEVDSVSGVGAATSANSSNCVPANGGSNGSGSTIPCSEDGGGLGPRFNGNSCAQCHSFPTVLGASPATNPQIAMATLDGATNTVPSFISLHGPIREARFINVPNSSGVPTSVLDGGVHELFTITGRVDATNATNVNGTTGTTCNIKQPNFAAAVANKNVSFRIPIQVRGDGLIELITDDSLVADVSALASQRSGPGGGIIGGVFNTSPNDGTISRFGWKA
ncbi:MAG TPA: hypothetical protein VKZ53_15620, partial [Candidatus Angelobacter sp.]|nr:hypothetical protein [Candidatus Angelobacter sp.]